MVQKRKYTRILMSGNPVLFAAILCIAVVSCRKDDGGKGDIMELEDFIEKRECGLVGYGGYLFKYSGKDCQISVNLRRRYIRMQNDIQTDYVHAEFDELPYETGKNMKVGMRYRVSTDEIVNTIPMTSVRVTADKVWLWNGENRIGLIIPFSGK